MLVAPKEIKELGDKINMGGGCRETEGLAIVNVC
jgi:hypothetical protein